jgi:hypothetical protein
MANWPTDYDELTSPADGDKILVTDVSETTVGKKVKWWTNTGLKAFLKTYFDTLYLAITAKAIGSELDTGSNDTKYVTAKAISDSHNVPSVAPGTSGNVLTSDGSAWTSASTSGGISIASNSNRIFNVSTVGASGWTGTINGAPSGAVVTYTNVSGNKNTLVPVSTSEIGKQRLYNTTRGDHALISTSNGTTTITLTATAPITWQNGDTITTLSQTVAEAGYVDIEITSGITAGIAGLIMSGTIKDSTTPNYMIAHPTETYAAAKYQVIYSQVAAKYISEFFFVNLNSNCISLFWSASGADTASLYIAIVAEIL